MEGKRFLVITSSMNKSWDTVPGISGYPCNTIDEAVELLKEEFESTVRSVTNGEHTPVYADDGTAQYCDSGLEYSFDPRTSDAPLFHVWDGDECTYDGIVQAVMFEISEAEAEAAHRELRQKLVAEAEKHFHEYIGFDPNAEGDEGEADNLRASIRFADEYGFSPDEACNNSSEFFLLEDIARFFTQTRENDPNIGKDDAWKHAIQERLGQIPFVG